MGIIPSPPNDINQCGLLKVLHQKSSEYDGIASQVQKFLEVATPMVDFVIAGPFGQYTLHNRDHAKKLIHLFDYLVSKDTIQGLSSLECLFFIYSAFLHDMGMVITPEEREHILESAEFQDSMREWPEISNSIKQARQRLTTCGEKERAVIETHIFQLHEAELCFYMRPLHANANRYKELIEKLKIASNDPELFKFKGISFEDILIEVCVSHNQDCAILNESKNVYEDRFPRDLIIAHESINVQFCAALLRLADILDFDRERTPKILFESIGISSNDLPGADVSLLEWEKHMSIHSIEIREDEIVISAESHHPAIEKSIRDFCSLIERELRDTTAILKRNKPIILDKYPIELPLTVRPRITSVGYDYRDLSLRLNQAAIISLLMGDKLYKHSGVALRELIQNALDACDVRRRIEPINSYLPNITVSSFVDNFGKTWIEVNDNGIGMDEHVISEFFLKVGDSYYSSSEFTRQFLKQKKDSDPFLPISKFGIGILSTFLIADILEVRTRSLFSPRDDNQTRLIRIEKLGGLAFISNLDKEIIGTSVRIRLRPEISTKYDDFANLEFTYLQHILIRPWYMVRISLGPGRLTFNVPSPNGAFYTISKAGKKRLSQQGFEIFTVQLSQWSDKLTGVVVILFARTKDGYLSDTVNGHRVVFDDVMPDGGAKTSIIPNFRGNRFTVNGFLVSGFRPGNTLRFSSGIRLTTISDIDAIGGDEIEFDVSRERLTERGVRFLQNEIKMAVVNALIETGMIEKLTPEIKLMLAEIPRDDNKLRDHLSSTGNRPDAIKFLFDSVAREIPNTKWPKGLHHQIAVRLGITPSLASKVISSLIRTGIVKKPKE